MMFMTISAKHEIVPGPPRPDGTYPVGEMERGTERRWFVLEFRARNTAMRHKRIEKTRERRGGTGEKVGFIENTAMRHRWGG